MNHVLGWAYLCSARLRQFLLSRYFACKLTWSFISFSLYPYPYLIIQYLYGKGGMYRPAREQLWTNPGAVPAYPHLMPQNIVNIDLRSFHLHPCVAYNTQHHCGRTHILIPGFGNPAMAFPKSSITIPAAPDSRDHHSLSFPCIGSRKVGQLLHIHLGKCRAPLSSPLSYKSRYQSPASAVLWSVGCSSLIFIGRMQITISLQ